MLMALGSSLESISENILCELVIILPVGLHSIVQANVNNERLQNASTRQLKRRVLPRICLGFKNNKYAELIIKLNIDFLASFNPNQSQQMF